MPAARQLTKLTLCSSALCAAIIWFSVPQAHKIFFVGFCCADDAFFAVVARTMADQFVYALPMSSTHITHFSAEIGSGPGLIVPVAVMIRFLGAKTWVPGLATFLLFVGQLTTFYIILIRRFGLPNVALYAFCCTMILGIVTTFRDYYSQMLGEAPSAGWLLIACAILSGPSIKRAPIAGLCLGLAFLTKNIALFAGIGIIIGWLGLSNRRDNSGVLTAATWLIFYTAIPILGFECVKLVALGVDGYRAHWLEFLAVSSTLHMGPPNRLDALMAGLSMYPHVFGAGLVLLVSAVAAWSMGEANRYSNLASITILLLMGASAHLLYAATVSSLNDRYLWIGIVLFVVAAPTPVLLGGGRVIAACILSLLVFVANLPAIKAFWTFQIGDATGLIELERKEIVDILDENPTLPLIGQSWQSIFDIVYLLPPRANWFTTNDAARVGQVASIVVWNNHFINNEYAFPTAVATYCTNIRPLLHYYTVYRCGAN